MVRELFASACSVKIDSPISKDRSRVLLTKN